MENNTRTRDEMITLGVVMALAAAGFIMLCAVWGQDAASACTVMSTVYANCKS